MKTKPDRGQETPREQVIKEAMKIDSDDIVTMTFKVPRELQQGYKMYALKNSETMTEIFIKHMRKCLNN